jgi:hypothetical protein
MSRKRPPRNALRRTIVALILVPAGLALMSMSLGRFFNVGRDPSLAFADTSSMDSDVKMIAIGAEAKSAMKALQARKLGARAIRIELP